MPSLCRVKLPVSTDWFNPSIAHQYSCRSEAIFEILRSGSRDQIHAQLDRLPRVAIATPKGLAMTTYTVPGNPADREAAAIELIVRLPAARSQGHATRTQTADWAGRAQRAPMSKHEPPLNGRGGRRCRS